MTNYSSRQKDSQNITPVLIDWIEEHIKDKNPNPPLLFVSGAQGVGKSTALISAMDHFDKKIAVLGLDEFYLPKKQRIELNETVHPLFKTRGVPGTHEVPLLKKTIEALLEANANSHTSWPAFSKKHDDRLPNIASHQFIGKPLAIIVEGWMMGVGGDKDSLSESPLNKIEEQDPDNIWRSYQEEQLEKQYIPLWDLADAFFHILAPSFEIVRTWRCQQEETTLNLANGTLPPEKVEWVDNFILYYQRITQRMLKGNRRKGLCVEVDKHRNLVRIFNQ